MPKSDSPHLQLFDASNSSASYRLRIALALLGLPYERIDIDLKANMHRAEEHLVRNPQGLVPVLVVDGKPMTQSLAVIEYLHAITSGSRLLPEDPAGQYQVRRLAYAIAMEVHPVCNRRVAEHAAAMKGGDNASISDWMAHYIGRGLADFEELLNGEGPYCHGDQPTMADCVLIPQLRNADVWNVPYRQHKKIMRVVAATSKHPVFQAARKTLDF